MCEYVKKYILKASILFLGITLLTISVSAEDIHLKIEGLKGKQLHVNDSIVIEILESKEGIQVNATNNRKCFIPYSEIREATIACWDCGKKGDLVREKAITDFRDMLMNAENGDLTCTFNTNKLVSYRYLGNTTIDNESILILNSMLFDSANYEEIGEASKNTETRYLADDVIDFFKGFDLSI